MQQQQISPLPPAFRSLLRIYICPCGFTASGRRDEQVEQTTQDHAAYAKCPQFGTRGSEMKVSVA